MLGIFPQYISSTHRMDWFEDHPDSPQVTWKRVALFGSKSVWMTCSAVSVSRYSTSSAYWPPFWFLVSFLASSDGDSPVSFWGYFFMPHFLLWTQDANNRAVHLLARCLFLRGHLLCLHHVWPRGPALPGPCEHLTYAEPLGPFPSLLGFDLEQNDPRTKVITM